MTWLENVSPSHWIYRLSGLVENDKNCFVDNTVWEQLEVSLWFSSLNVPFTDPAVSLICIMWHLLTDLSRSTYLTSAFRLCISSLLSLLLSSEDKYVTLTSEDVRVCGWQKVFVQTTWDVESPTVEEITQPTNSIMDTNPFICIKTVAVFVNTHLFQIDCVILNSVETFGFTMQQDTPTGQRGQACKQQRTESKHLWRTVAKCS